MRLRTGRSAGRGWGSLQVVVRPRRRPARRTSLLWTSRTRGARQDGAGPHRGPGAAASCRGRRERRGPSAPARSAPPEDDQVTRLRMDHVVRRLDRRRIQPLDLQVRAGPRTRGFAPPPLEAAGLNTRSAPTEHGRARSRSSSAPAGRHSWSSRRTWSTGDGYGANGEVTFRGGHDVRAGPGNSRSHIVTLPSAVHSRELRSAAATTPCGRPGPGNGKAGVVREDMSTAPALRRPIARTPLPEYADTSGTRFSRRTARHTALTGSPSHRGNPRTAPGRVPVERRSDKLRR